jgi:hypothetical protein
MKEKLIQIGFIDNKFTDYKVSTSVKIKNESFLTIEIYQECEDLDGHKWDNIIFIEQGSFAPFYELIEKALWRCLDIEADAALKLEKDAAN